MKLSIIPHIRNGMKKETQMKSILDRLQNAIGNERGITALEQGVLLFIGIGGLVVLAIAMTAAGGLP